MVFLRLLSLNGCLYGKHSKMFLRNISKMGGRGLSIPKLYVKFLWPLFLKFSVLFLNLAKIHILIPKCSKERGRGSTGLGNIPKKTFFWVLTLLGFQFVEQAVATPYVGV